MVIIKKVSPTEPRDIWYFRVRDVKDDYEINVDPDLANKDAMTIFINYRVFDYNHHYIRCHWSWPDGRVSQRFDRSLLEKNRNLARHRADMFILQTDKKR
jgi:hypothetical protein